MAGFGKGGGSSSSASFGPQVAVEGGTIPAREFAQKIAQLQYSGQKELANEYLKKYGGQIDKTFLRAAGVKIPKNPNFIQHALTAAAPIFNVLNRPLQVVEAGIHDVAGTIAHTIKPDAYVEDGGYGNILKAASGHGDFTPEKMMQRDFNNFGAFKPFAKFAMEAGMDPITYVTGGLGGSSRGTEAAAEILGREAVGTAAAQASRFRQAGWRALEPEVAAAGEAAIRGSTNVELMAGRKAGFLRPQRTVEQVGDQIMQQVERGGQQGLRFAGRTVLPYTDNTIAALAPVRKAIKVAMSPLAKAGRFLTPNLKIVENKAFGKEGEALLHMMDGVVNAADHRLGMDVSRRYSKIFQEAYKDLSKEEVVVLSNALETGELAAARAEVSEAGNKVIDAFDAIRTEESGHAIFNEGIEAANGARLRASRPNEELMQIEQTARETALAERTAAIQAPLAKAQEKLDKARIEADVAIKKAETAAQAAEPKTVLPPATSAAMKAEEGVVFHGTPTELKGAPGDIFNSGASPEGQLFGSGFYTTADPTIAESYTKKGFRSAAEKAQQVHAFKWAGEHPPKILNLEGPAPELNDVVSRLFQNGEANWLDNAAVSDIEDFKRVLANPEATGAEVYRKFRELIGGAELQRSEAGDILGAVSESLKMDHGFDALTHVGGRYASKTGVEHQVSIWLNPEKLSPVGKWAPGETVPGVGKAVTKTATPYQTARLNILEERARVARKALKEAEKKSVTAEAVAARRAERIPAVAEKAAAAARNEAARSDSFLKKSTEYLKANMLTDEGRRLWPEIEKLDPTGALHRSLEGDLAAIGRGGSEKNRVFRGTQPERNKVWLEKLEKEGIKAKGPIFEEDPLKRMAQGSLDVGRAANEIQMLADLTRMTDNLGRPMAITGENAAERAAEVGFERVPSHTVEAVYMHPDLIERQMHLNGILYNDERLQAFNDLFDTWSRNWAGLATNFNTPKRLLGDMFNNFVDGVLTHGPYERAAKWQMADIAAGKETGRAVGKDFEAALRRILGDEREADMFLEALKRSNESAGLLGGDIQAIGRDIVTGKQAKKGIIMGSKPMEIASRWNRLEEGNVRLANFINSVEKTGSYDIAQKHVNTFLFDYQYLSNTEKAFKKYARFYTYLRNNTPLQIRMMIEKPGIYSNYFRATQGSLPGAGIMPQYAVDKGDFRVGKNMLGVGFPIEDAMQNITPIAHALGATPGIQKLLPSELRPEGGVAQALRESIRPITGGPVELGKAAVEQITGKSLFTGGDITKSTGGRAKQLLQSVLPPVGKFNEPQGGWSAGNILARALNISVTPINDKTSDGELKRRLALVEGALAKAKANGTYVPTIQELRDAKLIPSLKETKRIFGDAGIVTSVPKKKMSAAEKERAARAKITL